MTDDFMEEGEQHAETIQLALAGDAEAGRYALLLCRDQLVARTLRPALADYLAARLNDVLEGEKLEKALRVKRGRGRPSDPSREWEQQLGAMGALLTNRGYKRNRIANALCDARAMVHDKPLESSDAYRIRKKWRVLESHDDRTLRHMAGLYCEILSEYPPLK